MILGVLSSPFNNSEPVSFEFRQFLRNWQNSRFSGSYKNIEAVHVVRFWSNGELGKFVAGFVPFKAYITEVVGRNFGSPEGDEIRAFFQRDIQCHGQAFGDLGGRPHSFGFDFANGDGGAADAGGEFGLGEAEVQAVLPDMLAEGVFLIH